MHNGTQEKKLPVRETKLPLLSLVLFWVSPFLFGVFVVVLLRGGVETIVGSMFVDDSFYYLQIAWILKTHGIVSFDGIHQTNGIQFAWFILCYLLALVSASKAVLLCLSAIASAFFCAIVYWLIWRAGRLLEDSSGIFVVSAAAAWTFFVFDLATRQLGGMEASMQMTALWLCLITFLRLMGKLAPGHLPRSDFFAYLIALTFLVYCRLDAAIFATCFVVVTIWKIYDLNKENLREFIREHAGTLCVAASLVVVGAAVEFGFFMAAGGTLVPVSGIAKGVHAMHYGTRLLPSDLLLPFPTIAHLLSKRVGTTFLSTLAVVLFLAAAILPLLFRDIRRWSPSLLLFNSTLALGTIFYGVAVSYQLGKVGAWYLSPVIMLYILSAASLGRFAFQRTSRSFVYISVLACLTFAVLVGIFVYRNPIYLYQDRVRVAHWINQNIPENSRIGSFNAGQIAYFSGRTVINLDGLVNNAEYSRNVLFQGEKIPKYFSKNGIKYFVDYDTYWARAQIEEATCVLYIQSMTRENTRPIVVRRWLGKDGSSLLESPKGGGASFCPSSTGKER